MMAAVSELSMRQAESGGLQQTVRTKEAELEQAYLRMEQGQAPSEETARAWERMVRDQNRRKEDVTLRKMVRIHFSIQGAGEAIIITSFQLVSQVSVKSIYC